MRKTRWIVAVDWIDGDVEDTSEILVYAESARQAVSEAKKKFRLTNGTQWPSCRIQRAFILTDKAAQKLAPA